MTMAFTYSTDDGHPSDMKMAELLSMHCLNGTFYIPITNRECREVLAPSAIREIACEFEVGSHTHDHCYLNRLNIDQARFQIVDGKHRLEEILGKEVVGFCYPGGKYDAHHLDMVKEAGFEYARTTMNLCFDPGADPFRMRTTLQFYPHDWTVYVSNYLKSGNWPARTDGLMLALKPNSWLDRLYCLFDWALKHGLSFHLWSHSWEIDKLDAWQELSDFLGYVTSQVPAQDRLSNCQLADRSYARQRVERDRPAPVVR